MEGIELGCVVNLFDEDGNLIGTSHWDQSVPEIELVQMCFNLNFNCQMVRVWQRKPEKHTTEYYYEEFFKTHIYELSWKARS